MQRQSSQVLPAFIAKLQKITADDSFPSIFWRAYSSQATCTFADLLNKYSEYYQALDPSQREQLSQYFWDVVKEMGTPIIEDGLTSTDECRVYFLFPKKAIPDSEEAVGEKQDLYLQGDYHGYGATDGRQKLEEVADTGIMCRMDSMPRDAVVVYSYIHAEPSQRGTKPTPEHSPFFENSESFVAVSTNPAIFPSFTSGSCRDTCSSHSSPFPGFEWGEKAFRVNASIERSHLSASRVDWPALLDANGTSPLRHFACHAVLYSDVSGDLHRADAAVTENYHDDLHQSASKDSPFNGFTRCIQVFKPTSGKVDEVVLINDGIPYLITGMPDRFDEMVAAGTLSANTALVFVNIMPGLEATLNGAAVEAYRQDPSTNLPGMGVRMVDYKHGIDQYIDFIANKLIPYLNSELAIPNDSQHRIMIGSSLSGTAALYIGAKQPDLVGAVVAQSPSADNRFILGRLPVSAYQQLNVHLSCGAFEHPDYAAANANIEYAQEVANIIGTELHVGNHGHQFLAWNDSLRHSVPQMMVAANKGLRQSNSAAATSPSHQLSQARSMTLFADDEQNQTNPAGADVSTRKPKV